MPLSLKTFWDETKTSKSILFNVAAGVVAALPLMQDNMPVLQDVLPADYYGLLLKVVVTGNLFLRISTKVKLAIEAAKPGGNQTP
ncbi:hypothetical protein [Hydrocarboniphaga effusa]|uniref:hypothetical protein n=1 Tax=Hydrocarboniphaga effusa TaxID=243629 RepID=UPI003BA9C655